jgi:hypothetical protein
MTEVFAISNKSIKTPSRAPLKLTNMVKIVKFKYSIDILGLLSNIVSGGGTYEETS